MWLLRVIIMISMTQYVHHSLCKVMLSMFPSLFEVKTECFVCLCCCVLQKVSEKVGGAEGTKLDEDFTEMEKVRLQSSL